MRKLPVMDAFSHAVRSTMNNLAFAFHASWPWLLVLLPLVILVNIYMVSTMGSFDPASGQLAPGAFVAIIAMALVNAIAFASIAVNWHRYVLLDEVPQGAQRLRVDGPVWRYFGNTLLIGLIIGLGFLVLVMFIVVLALIAGQAAAIIAVPLYIAGILAAIAAFYRYGLKLPAIALERRDFGLKDAWQATQGNFWQLVGLGILLFILGLIVVVVGAILAGGLAFLGTIGTAIGVAVQLVLQWLLTILGITILTSLYGFFVEGRNF